jgi:hypothetical protein
MKAPLFAAAVALAAVNAPSLPAWADGPRPSSENNWPGMTNAVPTPPAAVATAPAQQAAAPRYVWQEGYDHGGKWHGHWVTVQ